MAASFPLGPPLPAPLREGLWPTAWFCLAPLIVAAASSRTALAAAGLGLLAGLAGFLPLLRWMQPFLVRWGRLSWPEASATHALLVLYLALYPAAFAWIVHRVAFRWGPARALLLAPPAWTALELARGRLMTGFPWCLLGYSQTGALPALQVADLAGVYGVSFMLACASSLVAALAWRAARGGRGRRAAVAAPAAIVVACLAYGGWRLAGAAAEVGAGDPEAALVQSGVPQEEKWDPRERDRIEALHADASRRAGGAGASLVIWSESSVPIALSSHPDYRQRLEALSREIGADLLVGSVSYEVRGDARIPFNSAYLVRPDQGVAGRYDKRHLVPFGEYVPLRRLLSFIEPLVQEAGDFEPGREASTLPARAGPLGILICYEAIFPELARDLVRAGARALVNITNDSWYGDTGMPAQHVAHAVVRAVESRRWLLRCASTGVTAIVEPTGRIASRADVAGAAMLRGRFRPEEGETLYVRAGDAFAWACAILTVLSILAASRAAPPGGPDAP